jgi:hypothetical protein
MVSVQCKKCGKKFLAKPAHVAIGYAKFCSRDCQYAARRTGSMEACFRCGKKIYRAPRMTARTKSGHFFCSKSCQTQWRNQLYVGERHTNYRHGKASYRGVMVRAGIKKICRLCKTKDERILAVHHIDENRKNNSIENLMYLCHNCHHLIHHYPSEKDKLMAIVV